MLAHEISLLVARGRRIESRSEFFAVLARGPHYFELREIVRVDEWGNTSVERLPLSRAKLAVLAAIVFLLIVIVIRSVFS